jgi:hypothetical protein
MSTAVRITERVIGAVALGLLVAAHVLDWGLPADLTGAMYLAMGLTVRRLSDVVGGSK